MFFFNDECDIRDDDQYDFFTLSIQVERRWQLVRSSSSGRFVVEEVQSCPCRLMESRSVS